VDKGKSNCFPCYGFLLPGGCLYSKSNANESESSLPIWTPSNSHSRMRGRIQTLSRTRCFKRLGFKIMLGLLPDAMQRCDFSEQFTYTKETFERQLKPLTESSLLGQWRKISVENALSTQGRRKLLLGQLKELMKVKPPAPAAPAVSVQP